MHIRAGWEVNLELALLVLPVTADTQVLQTDSGH